MGLLRPTTPQLPQRRPRTLQLPQRRQTMVLQLPRRWPKMLHCPQRLLCRRPALVRGGGRGRLPLSHKAWRPFRSMLLAGCSRAALAPCLAGSTQAPCPAGVSQAPYPAGSAQAPCSACSAPSSLLWNSITILNNCFLLYFKMLFILVMQIWIFSIITQVFIVTWSFRNSSNMLIWCSKIMSSFLLLMHKRTTFINLDIPGLRSACFRGQCRVIFSSQNCGNVIGRKGNTILF